MRNGLDKVVEKIKTFYVQYLFSENRTIYGIMLKNVLKTEGPQVTSQYGAHALNAGEQSCMHVRICSRTHTPINNKKVNLSHYRPWAGPWGSRKLNQ